MQQSILQIITTEIQEKYASGEHLSAEAVALLMPALQLDQSILC